MRGATLRTGTLNVMLVTRILAGIVIPIMGPEYEMPLTVTPKPFHAPDMNPLDDTHPVVATLSKTAVGTTF